MPSENPFMRFLPLHSSMFLLVVTLAIVFLPESTAIQRSTLSIPTTKSKVTRPSKTSTQNLLLQFRGGQTSQNPYPTNPQQPQQPPQQEQYQGQYMGEGRYEDNPNYNNNNNSNNYYPENPETGAGADDNAFADHLFQESVQDRVDRWRQAQMSQSQSRTTMQDLNPRDEQGRMKLIASVSKGSRAFIFFVLMWRDIHLFETADQSLKSGGVLRLMAVIPLTLLFIGNMAGVVASFTSPGHATKKRMKAILNLDKIVEVLLLGWYFLRLTVLPSKFIPRELFIANTLHSVFFLIQCQAFTRVTWDEFPGANQPPMQEQAEAGANTQYPQSDYNHDSQGGYTGQTYSTQQSQY